MNAIADINFHYLHPPFHFKNRKKLKAFIREMFLGESIVFETVDFIFCTDEYLNQINRQHLNHDTYTDIITFQLSAKTDPVVSDIYISIPRVKENAAAFSTTFTQELHRVIFHGILHLCGYNDKSAKDVQLIRAKEDFHLDRYFVSREI
jgi:rRNA maturation RNase YbeY